MIKRIHVNQHIIKANRVHGRNDAPLTIKTSGENVKAHEVFIDGPSTVTYEPESPLSCGARVWIETDSAVVIHIHDGATEPRFIP